jgi:4-hydroxy-3-methylbut-2-enyl diphosphate reductase
MTNSDGAVDCILAFNENCQLAVRTEDGVRGVAFTGDDLTEALRSLESVFPDHSEPDERFSAAAGGRVYRVHLVQVRGEWRDPAVSFRALADLEASPTALSASLAGLLPALEPHLVEIPYLALGENDFIYKFRPEKERNHAIYSQDPAAAELYQSRLFSDIKSLARRHERLAADPVTLDFGPVQYVIPSHFGFCLGVKNAIEKAYETLAENPGRRVFMLSELIHNPFVNEDLLRRGLRYLQTDKGVPFTVDGRPADHAPPGARLRWDDLTSNDIVIIPAFGATDEDKKRLVRKGLAVFPHDATCMLVEKVWKAARAYGRAGYTVIIHGKHEHEETKATFANTRRHAPALIVRNLDEARQLAEIFSAGDAERVSRFYQRFAGRYTPGFDVERDLARIAVVNQTTLLMNETREIISFLRSVYSARFGPDDPAAPRVGGGGRNDTLCYATQVNQDALGRALEQDLDGAIVVGGRNSSNTYQLYRLCEQRLGDRALFIQSEANIRSPAEVEHFVFPAKGSAGHEARTELRPLWTEIVDRPLRLLITGGASCPDGIIQHVMNRINSFFAPGALRSPDAVLAELERPA